MTTAMKSRKATKAQSEITAATVNRVICRETGTCLGYLIKSDSSTEYYQVTFNHSRHQYECTCPATKPCKHIRAVQEVCQARKEMAVQREAEKVASHEDRRPEAEALLLELNATQYDVVTATEHDLYECAVAHLLRIQQDMIDIGYTPYRSHTGWSI